VLPPPHSRAALEDILGCKWTMDVLRAIEAGGVRPSALKRSIPGLTTKVMNERLRKLIRLGVLDRRVFDDRPPRVEYRLTRRGRALRPLLRQIDRIIARWDDHDPTRRGRSRAWHQLRKRRNTS
jgi:DNA-binding HxlR family transcriptional regulator